MSLTIGLLLALSFLVSLLALAFLIWAVTNRQLQLHQGQAYTVFTPGEAGTPDDATMAGEDTQSVGPHHYDTEREGIDAVSRRPVMILIGSGITWLVIGSIFGLMASLKLHWPDWLPTTWAAGNTPANAASAADAPRSAVSCTWRAGQ